MRNENIKRRNLAKIKQIASEMFFDEGIERVTMNRIAAAAGLSKVSLYKHFPSKFAIVTDVLEDHLSKRGKQYAMHLRRHDLSSLSGAEQLCYVLGLFTLIREDDPQFYSLFVEYNTHLLRSEPDLEKVKALYKHIDEQIWPFFFQALDTGQKDGSLRFNNTPEVLYELISSVFRGVYMSFFLKYISDLSEQRYNDLRNQLNYIVEATMTTMGTSYTDEKREVVR